MLDYTPNGIHLNPMTLRKRTYKLQMWMSDAERRALDSLVEKYDMTVSDIVRKLVKNAAKRATEKDRVRS